MEDVRLAIIRQVERELAEFEVIDAAVENGLAERHRRYLRPSVVYSLRLDPGEVDALHRRAAALGVKPSVLARNLLRAGLVAGSSDWSSPDASPP
jgi:hypothetical protein